MTQKLSRRRFLQYTGIAAGTAILAACGAAPATAPASQQQTAPTTAPAAAATEAPAPTTAPAAGGGKTIEAWSRMTDVAADSTKKLLDAYNSKNTKGIKASFVYIAETQGSQADEKLLTAVAGGNPPGVYYADRFTVPQFAYQGFFTDITDPAKAAGVTQDQYFPFAWQEATYKDHIYALPFDTDTRALWWNKDTFKEAGLDPEKGPQTLDELKSMATKLTQKGSGGQITRFGFHPLYDQMWLYTWGFMFKGEFQDPQTKKITFSNPNVVKSMNYVKQWVTDIGIQDIDAMIAACAGAACNGPNDWFWTGQFATVGSGDWKVSQAKQFKPDGHYGVVPLPGPDGPAPFGSWAGGWSWAVPKGYKDVTSAFDVVSYLCGPEGLLQYCKDTYHIPTIKSAAQDKYFRDDPLHAVFMDLLPVSHSRPPIPFGSKLWDMQVTAFRDQIPHGTKTVEQALGDIDTTINKDLEDAKFFA
jgi:multiple sugar transport system substrate-binding protein